MMMMMITYVPILRCGLEVCSPTTKLDNLRWFSQRRSRTPHFLNLGGAHPGGYDPQIWTLPRFVCSAPTPQFHHPIFTRSEVIVLTSKQRNKHTDRCRWKHQTLFATLRRWAKIGLWTRVLMTLFRTSNIDITKNCRDVFGVKLPNVQWHRHWLLLGGPNAGRHIKHCIPSVRPSVCLSVCLSVCCLLWELNNEKTCNTRNWHSELFFSIRCGSLNPLSTC